MLRVVADANVLISAALARSPNAPSVMILEAALDGRLELVTSPQLLGEITSVLNAPACESTSRQMRRCDSSLTSPPRPSCSPIRRGHTPPCAATPTTTTWSRSRPPATRARSSPVIPTSTQSTPTNWASRSSHHASSSTASPDRPFVRFFRTASPRHPIRLARRDGAGLNRRQLPALKAKLVATA